MHLKVLANGKCKLSNKASKSRVFKLSVSPQWRLFNEYNFKLFRKTRLSKTDDDFTSPYMEISDKAGRR